MYDEVRGFLESARETQLKYAEHAARVLELDSKARRVTASASLAPGGGGDKERLLATLADERERMRLLAAEELVRLREIEEFIDRVPGRDIHRIILRRRYLHYESWNGVTRYLKANGLYYEKRQIYRLHGEAIGHAREQWEKEHKEETK